jgi:poly(A) polymerase
MRMQRSQTLTWLRLSFALLAIYGFGAGLVSPSYSQDAAGAATAQRQGFQAAFSPGSRDAAGHFMGGTEMRTLVAHAGKLFAGNGYWMDEPGPEGMQGAEILVLDRPGGRWRVDHAFEEWTSDGNPRHLAVGAMGEAHFATDGNGKPLANPVSILVASTWDLTGEVKVFARDDASGAWTGTTLAYDERIPGNSHLSQVRSFGSHRDRVTGIDYVFAGHDPHGIFSGVYDPAVPGRIRWSQTPEFDISTVSVAEFPGMEGRLRVTSFAEGNDRLYATVGQQIYERTDGAAPRWRLIYTNSAPGRSQSGLRGLTAVPSPDGQGHVLLAAVEGTEPRIVRIDPRDGSEATDLDLHDFLGKAWGMEVGYTIAAYNNMADIRDGHGDDVFLIGLEAFIPRNSQLAAGHKALDIGKGRLEGNAWYLIRDSNGTYDLRRIPARPGQPTVSIPGRPGQPMVATRSIVASPFPADSDAIYFAGFDANKAPAHNTAWVVRSTVEEAIGGSH